MFVHCEKSIQKMNVFVKDRVQVTMDMKMHGQAWKSTNQDQINSVVHNLFNAYLNLNVVVVHL